MVLRLLLSVSFSLQIMLLQSAAEDRIWSHIPLLHPVSGWNQTGKRGETLCSASSYCFLWKWMLWGCCSAEMRQMLKIYSPLLLPVIGWRNEWGRRQSSQLQHWTVLGEQFSRGGCEAAMWSFWSCSKIEILPPGNQHILKVTHTVTGCCWRRFNPASFSPGTVKSLQHWLAAQVTNPGL